MAGCATNRPRQASSVSPSDITVAALPRSDEPDWLTADRTRHASRVSASGLPDRAVEAWKYTPMRLLGGVQLTNAANDATAPEDAVNLTDSPGYRAVFVDGRLRGELSRLPQTQGVRCLSIIDALRGRTEAPWQLDYDGKALAFAALNSAQFSDGLWLQLDAGVTLDEPLSIVHVARHGSGAPAHLRHWFHLNPGARADLRESFVRASDGRSGLTSVVTVANVESDAALSLTRVQELAPSQHLVRRQEATLGARARLRQVAVDLGGAMVRNEEIVSLQGREAAAELHGLYVVDGERHVDNYVQVVHDTQYAVSEQNYRGILADRARGVFNGKVLVHPDAVGTDARQSNPNLLLSSRAEVDTKPELEIYADDVACSHGATVGQLDADALFYLQSRGIAPRAALAMLTGGFAAEILAHAPESMRGAVRGSVDRVLDGLELEALHT